MKSLTLKHTLPLLAGLCVLSLGLWTMPHAWAQTVSVPLGGATEIPPLLTNIPVIGDLLTRFSKWLPVVFQVVGAFSIIASMTANQTDDKIVNYILKAINFLGFNFGTAKNDANVGVTRK